MKKLVFLFTVFVFVVGNLLAEDKPRGSLLELHSCELYAGGCIVSSQATLEGRYTLSAWSFNQGMYAGEKLAGLRVAALQSSSQNLAAENASAENAVIYLPQDATAGQRNALLSWLMSVLPELGSGTVKTRLLPLQFAKTDRGYSFSAGDLISVSTTPLESCETGACGEALWYTPRAPTSLFSVAVNRTSRVSEPLLQLKWNDSGQRSVFLGKFGENTPARNQFVTSADFCSPAGKLF